MFFFNFYLIKEAYYYDDEGDDIVYILKNAITSIRRSKGRNILIGIIIIVIAVSTTVTLAIRSSADNIIKAYEEKNELEATITMNRRSLMEKLRDGNKTQEQMINAFNNIKNLTEEEINNYGKSDYIKEYYYSFELNVKAKNLTEATDSLVKETTTTKTETTTNTRTRRFGNNNSNRRPGTPPGGFGGSSTTTTTRRRTTTTQTEKIFNEKAGDGPFTLIGYNSYEDMKEFISGEYTITSGEVSSDFESNNCVISEELASMNSLSVGDTITIVDPNKDSNTYKIIISGIFKENSKTSDSMNSMFTTSANYIITNSNFVKTMSEKNSELEANINPTFILKDKSVVDDFENEVSEKGLSEYYQVSNNLETIENATKSVNNVKTFATTFLIITLAIGAIVLIVINMINIRERKYEIGVLRTIGMKKRKVSLQFMIELLIVAVISLSIGAFIGSYASVPVSNKLLAEEINNSQSEYNDIRRNFGMNNPPEVEESTVENKEDNKTDEVTENESPTETINEEETKNEEVKEERYNFNVANVEEIDRIDAVVDFKVLGQLLGIGVILTLLSSLASMIAISRFSPLTILKERS